MLVNLSKQELNDIYMALMFYRYNMEELYKDKSGFLERSERFNNLITKFVNECIYYDEENQNID